MDNDLRNKPDRTLSFKRVRELTDLSRTTVWRLQRSGAFPKPLKISPGRIGWLEGDILAWQRARSAEAPTGLLTAPSPGTAERAKPSPASSVGESTPPSPLAFVGPHESSDQPRAKVQRGSARTPVPEPAQLGFGF